MVWFGMGLGELWGVQACWCGITWCSKVCGGLWVWGMWHVVRRHLGVVWGLYGFRIFKSVYCIFNVERASADAPRGSMKCVPVDLFKYPLI